MKSWSLSTPPRSIHPLQHNHNHYPYSTSLFIYSLLELDYKTQLTLNTLNTINNNTRAKNPHIFHTSTSSCSAVMSHFNKHLSIITSKLTNSQLSGLFINQPTPLGKDNTYPDNPKQRNNPKISYHTSSPKPLIHILHYMIHPTSIPSLKTLQITNRNTVIVKKPTNSHTPNR